MTMQSSHRTYSGQVQGEVIIQGDLHAQGNINIGDCLLQLIYMRCLRLTDASD